MLEVIKIHRPSLKSKYKARRFIANSASSLTVVSNCFPDFQRAQCTQLYMRPFLLHAAFAKGAKSKFGSCIQWCLELFKSRMLIFSVAKGAMNPPRCYHVPKVKKTPKFVAKRKYRKNRLFVLQTTG